MRSVTSRRVAFSILESDVAALSRTHAVVVGREGRRRCRQLGDRIAGILGNDAVQFGRPLGDQGRRMAVIARGAR